MNLPRDTILENSEWLPLANQLRRDVLNPIKETLVGKDEILEVIGVSLVAGENTFLLGPPGTAKSALVNELASRIGGNSFDYLLTRFTEPSELFGPFDLRRLRDGDLVTNTEGMLPEADFVFLDELLNANSAVLNSLLLTLNERVFRRGRETFSVPMLLAIGASNRLPDDEALEALFDRFLLRVMCENVSTDRLGEVLDAGWRRESRTDVDSVMTVDEIRQLQQIVPRIGMSRVRKAYLQLIQRLREAGMPISDRRAVRLQRVIAASAIVCGRSEAMVSDLWVLRYIWDSPSQIEMLAAHVDAISKEFPDSDTSQEIEMHPLATSDQGPNPEQISVALDDLAGDLRQSHAADTLARTTDTLALLAARIEWVQNADSRDHLAERVECIRRDLTQLQESL